MKHLLIVGGGHLGSVFLDRFYAIPENRTNFHFYLIEKNQEKIAKLKRKLPDITPFESFKDASDYFQMTGHAIDLMIMSIRPLDYATTHADEFSFLEDDSLTISFMAGISLSTLKQKIPGTIIRCMPTIAASEGMSSNCFCERSFINESQHQMIESLFSSTGESLWIDESEIDAVTAMASSGLAFIYRTAKSLAKAGEAQGLSAEKSRFLAIKTIIGAGAILTHNPDMDSLISSVATKGGTTEAGLLAFEEKGNLDQLFKQSVDYATKRAREIQKKVIGD